MRSPVRQVLEQLNAIDHRAMVWCACQCVRTVLHAARDCGGATEAVDLAEGWVQGERTQWDCERAAEYASYHAYRAVEPATRAAAEAAAAVAGAASGPHDGGYEREVVKFVVQAATALASLTEHEGLDDAARAAQGDRHLAHLLHLVRETRWPMTSPTLEELAAAAKRVQVAWDAVCDDRTEHSMAELIEAHARAERLGLRWWDPVQRAVAERTTDEAWVRQLLGSSQGASPQGDT